MFKTIKIKTEKDIIEVNKIEEYKIVKEMLYDEGEHLNTFMLSKKGVYEPFSPSNHENNILEKLEKEGIEISKLKRDSPKLTSMNSSLIEAIVGKEEIKFLSIDESYPVNDLVLISIQDPDDKDDLTAYNKRFKKYLSVRFWDVEDDLHTTSGGFPVIPIEDKEAKEIATFISENKGEKFIIHCAAGQSRSAGTGLALECIINHNGDKYDYGQFPSEIKNHWRYSPNMVVYDKIVEKYKSII